MRLMLMNHFRRIDLCSRVLCSRITSGVSQGGGFEGARYIAFRGGVFGIFIDSFLKASNKKKVRQDSEQEKIQCVL